MSLLLAPYNNAMRLGQGFNSYTQQICIDDAVVIDPDRAENVVTNDGMTMRIMSQMSAKPSAWSRQREIVTDQTAQEVIARIESENDVKPTDTKARPGASLSPADTNDVAITDATGSEQLISQKTATSVQKKQPRDVVNHGASIADEDEKQRLQEQRHLRDMVDKENRDEERQRRYEDRVEQRRIRQEERDWQAQRRDEARKAVADAAKDKATAVTLDDLAKIRAQNQFVERFSGISDDKEKHIYDPTAPRGPSQTVVYSSKFIDRLSDITDDMAISGALSIKAARIGGSGRGSFVDSDKFKDSDLKFYISVKVVNQTVNFKDALVYNGLRDIKGTDFNKIFGDSFISGFVEGGEFNALVTMKVLNKAKLTDIKAGAKVALTAGPVDITAEANVGIARSNLEVNTETTIQVSWCGGGHIKPMEQPWTIESIMQAAARFPDLVADCPQRTYAILTKYDSLRSFVIRKPAGFTALQYENAQIYTNMLMDAFMTYKSMYKKLGEQAVSIQSKLIEFVPWDQYDANQPQAGTGAFSTSPSTVEDTSRFADSIKGLSDARTAVRRQMMYIVNEIDLIEEDPRLATRDDHKEPFQAPAAFEARIPQVKVPGRLQGSSQPLGGKRFVAKTQTQMEFNAQAKADEEAERKPMYDTDAGLTPAECGLLDAMLADSPSLGSVIRVSPPLGNTGKGEDFNNVEVVQHTWRVTSITVEVARGVVTFVELEYDNGFVLRRGKASVDGFKVFRFTDFRPEERVVSATIERGSVEGKMDDPRITALRLYTNRGRRMLAQATVNEIKGEKILKDGVIYEQIKSLHLDNPFVDGTIKGFFGTVSSESPTNGLLRLGIVWGSVKGEKPWSTPKGAEVSDYDEPLRESATQEAVNQLAQKDREIGSWRDKARESEDKANAAVIKLEEQATEMKKLQDRVNKIDTAPVPNIAQAGVLEPSVWSAGTASTPKTGVVAFPTSCKKVPRLITGLSGLNQTTPKEMALSMTPHSLTTSGFSASFVGRDGTDMASPKMSWMILPDNDIKFQSGYFDTENLPDFQARSTALHGIQNRQYYPEPFQNSPKVMVWLCNVNFPDSFHSIRVNASTGSQDYLDFSLTSQIGRPCNNVKIGWLAYDDTGSKSKIHHNWESVSRSDGRKERKVMLTKFGFTRPPAIFAAFSSLQFGNARPARLAIEVRNITNLSFDLVFGSSEMPHDMEDVSLWYIAVE